MRRLAHAWWRWGVVALVLGGAFATSACVDSAAFDCPSANGIVQCAPGLVCVANGEGCATPEQVAVCAGMPALAACATERPEIVQGQCVRGVCRASVCGDGERNANEVCDDGNVQSGDGCSANCQSREVCGNGIVELAERCDDGNQVDNDFCRNDCRVPQCGDGIVDGALGEACDAGALNANTSDAVCRATCRLPECGDGIVDPQRGEQCDSGHAEGTGTCHHDCLLPVCGDGIIDVAVGEQCDDGVANADQAGATCRRNCQVPHCGDGIVDSGEACDAGAANSDALANGCRTSCVWAFCGDGVQDTNEVCDDGNAQSGDGCAANCASREICGNGIVDTGEECDDGSRGLAQDGCSSRCQVEAWGWDDRSIVPTPPARRAALAYDEARQRWVLFPGTWEYDGATWVQAPSVVRPVLEPSGMAYDSKRQVVVLVGDAGESTIATWQWDGLTWTRRISALAPPARTGATLVYDRVRERMVLFGGSGYYYQAMSGGFVRVSTYFNDTWEFDGDNWTVKSFATQPSQRTQHGMVYDSVRSRVVLFGGVQGSSFNNETWEYDGNAWVRRTPATAPSARDAPAMYYDRKRQRTVLLGGRPNGSGVRDHWEYDGVNWVLRGATVERSLTEGTAAYADDREQVLIYGGLDPQTYAESNDTWLFDGQTWTARIAAAPMANGILHYEPLRGVLWLTADALWRFDGMQWTRPTGFPPPGCSVQCNPSFVVDSTRGRLVMVSGPVTYEYDHTTWRQVPIAAAPPNRLFQALVYDSDRKRVVMFGGWNPTGGTFLNDHWEYDGTTWVQRSFAQVPSVRRGAAAVYDIRRKRLVLIGGSNNMTHFREVWEFDGSTWQQRANSLPFATGATVTAAYDATRGQVVVRAARGTSATVWLWDGQGWSSATLATSASNQANDTMAYDARYGLFWARAGTTVVAMALRRASSPADACVMANVDSDGDGLYGCGPTPSQPTLVADPDCWGRCTPTCPPWTTYLDVANARTLAWPQACAAIAPTAPFCGDGACTGPLEDNALCPIDCP